MARLPYFFLKLLPTANKVVLISRNNLETSLDFSLLNKEIKRQSPRTKVVILNHYMRSRLSHVWDILVEMYHLATSRACIVDSYVIAVSILKHKKQLIIVQIWHALGAIKKFGYMTLDKKAGHSSELARIMNMHGNYTYITCGSAATIPIYQRTFGVPAEIIKPIGMPRVDYLLDKRVQSSNYEKIIRRYPECKDKKVILYAPTFRKGHRINMQPLVEQLDTDKYILLVGQHRLDRTVMKPQAGVIITKGEFDSMELLAAADYVITDYSALTFEAAVLNKPLFFWDYDYDRYEKECGFMIDYKTEMPGPVSPDAKEIMDSIKRRRFSLKQVREFADKWVSVRDGSCTKQIVGLLGL